MLVTFQNASITHNLNSFFFSFQAVAMAIVSAATALFAQFPGPLFAGYLYDLSCEQFRQYEDGAGECLSYSIDSIKNWVIRLSAGIHIISLLGEVIIVFLARDLNLYAEPLNNLVLNRRTENQEDQQGETKL